MHCVGYTNVPGAEHDPAVAVAANATTAAVVAAACRTAKVPFVLISTDYVFDGRRRSYNERDACAPLQWYGLSKYLGEQAVAAVGGRTLVVRLPLLYDLGGHPTGLVGAAVAQARAGAVVAIDGYQRRFPTFVDDAAQTILHLIMAGATGTVHVSAQQELSKVELMRSLAPVLDVDPQLFVAGSNADTLPLRPRRVRLRCQRLVEFGVTMPRSVDDVVAQHTAGLSYRDGAPPSV